MSFCICCKQEIPDQTTSCPYCGTQQYSGGQPQPGTQYPPPGGQYGAQPSQPYTGQPYTGQPPTAQPYTGQPYTGQPPTAQPYTGQPQPGQPYAGQPTTGQPYTGQPYPGQPYPSQPYPGQPYTGQPHPGVAPNQAPQYTASTMLTVCFLFGFLGIHRFMTGRIGTGVLMVLTLGGLGIWSIIDYILIFFSMFTDRHGVPILRDKKGTQVGIAGFILFGILYGSMYAEFIAEYVEYLANPW